MLQAQHDCMVAKVKVKRNWRDAKAFSDIFLSEIKGILGQKFIGEVEEEDQLRNTDLIVLTLKATRFACRIRRHSYLAACGDEFTLRVKVPSGAETELTKIVRGFGDYFFYGFANQAEQELEKWFIGDLGAFRVWFARAVSCLSGALPGKVKHNDDGTSFIVVKTAQVPGFVLHASPVRPVEESATAIEDIAARCNRAIDNYCMPRPAAQSPQGEFDW